LPFRDALRAEAASLFGLACLRRARCCFGPSAGVAETRAADSGAASELASVATGAGLLSSPAAQPTAMEARAHPMRMGKGASRIFAVVVQVGRKRKARLTRV
jgi:hypothetical protein